MTRLTDFVREHTRGYLRPNRREMSHTHLVRWLHRTSALEVPPHALDALLAAWAETASSSVASSTAIALHELLPCEYPFFVQARLPEDVTEAATVAAFRRALADFLPDAEERRTALGRCAVARGGDRLTRFVWPELLVTGSQALTMRERLVARLSADEARHDVRWHAILDYAVYTGDGPALPGSATIEACAHCRGGRGGRGCAHCDENGAVVQPCAPLQPAALYVEGAPPQPLDAGALALFAAHRPPSLGAAPTAPRWVRPPGTPHFACDPRDPRAAPRVYPTGDVHDFGVVTGASSRGAVARRGRGGGRGGQPTSGSHVPLPIVQLLQKAIRTTHARHHSQLLVTVQSVQHLPSQQRYVVSPLGIGCHTCGRFNGEHADSRVHFYVTPEGVAQACHSRETLPDGRECRSLVSDPKPLNQRLRLCLFPPSQCQEIETKGAALGVGYSLAIQLINHHAAKVFQTETRSGGGKGGGGAGGKGERRWKKPRNLYGE